MGRVISELNDFQVVKTLPTVTLVSKYIIVLSNLPKRRRESPEKLQTFHLKCEKSC